MFHTTRRKFLKGSLAAGGLVAWGLNVPAFLSRTALAAPTSEKPGAKDTILVVIEMTGGNDGLNTVIPFKDAEYAKLRPTLKQPEAQIKKINEELGLHPSLTGLADLLQDNSLCVVQGVGYPNPTQSHFRSMDIWQAASEADTLTEGWIGKALKALPGTPSFHLKSDNEKAPLALAGAPAAVPSIASLADFQLQMAAADGADKKNQREVIEGAAKSNPDGKGLLDFVQRTAADTYASSRRLQEIGKNYQPKSPYPNTPLANRLKLAAQLIDAGLGARIFYVAMDGYDTHSGQGPTHAQLLTTLSEGMTAFYKDLAARGHRDRVLLMTFSEFGRRAKENGSRGTDHGEAAPMLLVGGKVKSGVVGKHPSLTDLANGNLKYHTDFRQVYATILDQWLGVASKDVLGNKYEAVEIFKS
jgi:uncharacterized protein (DUF1501 family)